MEDFQSKYSGEQVEQLLDQMASGGTGGGGIIVETDPIFSASPAASITDEKKAEWDRKQDAISDLSAIREGAALGATALQEHQDISGKQDTLVSGDNIKTINGKSILGSGDITIESGNSDTCYLELPVNEEGQCLPSGTLTEEQFSKIANCKTLVARIAYMSGDGNSASEDISFDWSLAQTEQSDEGNMTGIVYSNICPNLIENCLVMYAFMFSTNGSEAIYELAKRKIHIDTDLFDSTDVYLSVNSVCVLNLPSDTEIGEITEEEFNKAINSKTVILDNGVHRILFTQRTLPQGDTDTYYFYGDFTDASVQKVLLQLSKAGGAYGYRIRYVNGEQSGKKEILRIDTQVAVITDMRANVVYWFNGVKEVTIGSFEAPSAGETFDVFTAVIIPNSAEAFSLSLPEDVRFANGEIPTIGNDSSCIELSISRISDNNGVYSHNAVLTKF